ncbi:hypothetical protein QVD17_04222 [Tagetes erecta]|uniref:Uncharacterized protein n=1 Tax=Tagetes erecta TaxID=13708 RepID=A0AAD8LF41_TARER|nr:hypothetical protein QVD17_04222 [Tagetes erecta]
MAYTNSKNKNELTMIGKDAFDAIDELFPQGRQSSKPQGLFHYHQYQPQHAYVVQQQVYDAPVATRMTEQVMTCEEAAKMYRGTLFLEYHKKKPARKGFFF